MQILTTIIPIFAVVILGWAARKRGFIPPEFLGPANRLVFFLAIPAMIFRAISRASLTDQFHGPVLFVTLISAALTYSAAFLASRLTRMLGARAGTFIQCAGHGNLGYVGLAVAFYYLGEDGLARAGILAGFLMILQNLLSVIALQTNAGGGDARHGLRTLAGQVMHNPVIWSALTGIAFATFHIPIPIVVQRTLDILSGLALPTALLVIGASISVKVMKAYIRSVAGAMGIKLFLLPTLGLLLFRAFHLSSQDYLPALILLASPTATIAYVMGREMQGDTDFAVAAISASTLVSAVSYTLWLGIVGMFEG